MQVKKQQLEPDIEQQIGSDFVNKYTKAVYCHLAYLIYMQSTSCEMDEAQAGIKIEGEISTTSDMQMTLPKDRKQRGTKEPLDEGERGE